jgi:hypothetical protein
MPAALTIAFASSLCFAPVSASAEHGVDVRTTVEVDTSEVGEAGPVIARRIRERSDVVLRREGVLPARDPDDPVIVVQVFEASGDDPGFAFELRAQRGGTDLLHTERFQCRLCTETELVTEVENRLASIVGELGSRIAELEPAADPAPEPAAKPAPPVDTSPPTRLGAMGKAGIGVLATGVVTLGVGVGLAIRKPQPQTLATKLTTTRPPGYALIGVGAAFVITGGILFAIDRRRAKGRTAFAPWFGPDGTGLALEHRF